MIERLAIVGIGLLGGSVAKAARAASLAREIVGIARDPRRVEAALRDGALDRVTDDVGSGVRDAELVVLAAPVLANERLLERVWAAATDGALITDVGSTKAGLARAAGRLHATRRLGFVGSHPMAGSEQSGYGAARADLFRGALVIVTPTETTEPRVVKAVSELWERVGARVATLDPDTHDRVVAIVSHLPHLAAVALVDAVRRFEPGATAFAGRGFKDTTRIAAGDAAVWEEILFANRDALLASCDAFRAALDDLEHLMRAGDAAALRDRLVQVKQTREAMR
ncbi:MAG: prephenate dehydrogenase/arogenate dehydrogenase family protein [Candidatus Rokubacteria bacterium]|nr:prephenate dehydrogenase/arogenate dehydrogenase family protein [Candidatus Rokubacteria bacterium]